MIYQENFYTYRFIRRPAEELRASYEVMEAKGSVEAAHIAKIEYYLTLGHEHFHAERYQEALKRYLLALGLAFQLIDPPFKPELNLGNDLTMPAKPELFEPLLEGVFKVLDQAPPTLEPHIFEVMPSADLGGTFEPYGGLGLGFRTPLSEVDSTLVDNLERAEDRKRAGAFQEAAALFKNALASDALGTSRQGDRASQPRCGARWLRPPRGGPCRIVTS